MRCNQFLVLTVVCLACLIRVAVCFFSHEEWDSTNDDYEEEIRRLTPKHDPYLRTKYGPPLLTEITIPEAYYDEHYRDKPCQDEAKVGIYNEKQSAIGNQRIGDVKNQDNKNMQLNDPILTNGETNQVNMNDIVNENVPRIVNHEEMQDTKPDNGNKILKEDEPIEKEDNIPNHGIIPKVNQNGKDNRVYRIGDKVDGLADIEEAKVAQNNAPIANQVNKQNGDAPKIEIVLNPENEPMKEAVVPIIGDQLNRTEQRISNADSPMKKCKNNFLFIAQFVKKENKMRNPFGNFFGGMKNLYNVMANEVLQRNGGVDSGAMGAAKPNAQQTQDGVDLIANQNKMASKLKPDGAEVYIKYLQLEPLQSNPLKYEYMFYEKYVKNRMNPKQNKSPHNELAQNDAPQKDSAPNDLLPQSFAQNFLSPNGIFGANSLVKTLVNQILNPSQLCNNPLMKIIKQTDELNQNLDQTKDDAPHRQFPINIRINQNSVLRYKKNLDNIDSNVPPQIALSPIERIAQESSNEFMNRKSYRAKRQATTTDRPWFNEGPFKVEDKPHLEWAKNLIRNAPADLVKNFSDPIIHQQPPSTDIMQFYHPMGSEWTYWTVEPTETIIYPKDAPPDPCECGGH